MQWIPTGLTPVVPSASSFAVLLRRTLLSPRPYGRGVLAELEVLHITCHFPHTWLGNEGQSRGVPLSMLARKTIMNPRVMPRRTHWVILGERFPT